MAPSFNTMPVEVKDMIVTQGTFLARRSDGRCPAIVAAFTRNEYYRRIIKLYHQVNGVVTEANQPVWRAMRLKESLQVRYLALVPLVPRVCEDGVPPPSPPLNMKGDKMMLMNNLQSILLDFTKLPPIDNSDTLHGSVNMTAQYLIGASRNLQKFTLKHHRNLRLETLIDFFNVGLGPNAPPNLNGRRDVRFVKQEGDGSESYIYVVWEAELGKRLVWFYRPSPQVVPSAAQ